MLILHIKNFLKNLTLIIPAKNEEDSLPIFLHELKNYNCKIIIVLSENDSRSEEHTSELQSH